jgi:hypothetical protein
MNWQEIVKEAILNLYADPDFVQWDDRYHLETYLKNFLKMDEMELDEIITAADKESGYDLFKS